MKNNLIYSPSYNTDLRAYGIDKPFALDRGQRVLDALANEYGKIIPYSIPQAISMEEAALVHTERYLGSLSQTSTWMSIFEFKDEEYRPENASKELPELLDDIRLKAGGTKLACIKALEHSFCANLGGGYHHAFPDEGRGFCVLHDIAIAIKSLQVDKLIKTAMVIDLDFHQGDGTARIFENDPSVFTFSVHSLEGWPDEKQKSDLDIEIAEKDCASYLEKTESGLLKALNSFVPDLAIFVAGSDPYELDVLPGTRFMKLTLHELESRDKMVIDEMRKRDIPLAMVFAGGYGPHVWEVHYRAVRYMLAACLGQECLSSS